MGTNDLGKNGMGIKCNNGNGMGIGVAFHSVNKFLSIEIIWHKKSSTN